MDRNPTWEVDLIVKGPITIKNRFDLIQPKGFQVADPFYSNIELKRMGTSGIQVTITAFASTSGLAQKAALLYFGQMLDVLAIKISVPLDLTCYEEIQNRSVLHHPERRIILRRELVDAFKEARLLAFQETTFLRALG